MQTFRTKAIQLDELAKIIGSDTESKTSKVPQVQILRVGTFQHEEFGEIKITPDTLRSMVKNFKNKVRGIELAIDFSHKSEGEAAGWFQELSLEEADTELWVKSEWTPPGRAALNEKRFRYLSADFTFNFIDNETKEEFGPTLLGAGLTNRPIVKRMTPALELSECSEVTNQEANMATVAEMQGQLDLLKTDMTKMQASLDSMKGERDTALEESKVLSENNKKLTTDNEGLVKEKTELTGKVELAEKKGAFSKLLSEGKAVPAQEEAYLAGDMAKFAELTGSKKLNLAPTGTETPKTPVESKTGESAGDKVFSLAEKKVADKTAKNVEIGVELVLAENKELADAYTKESAV